MPDTPDRRRLAPPASGPGSPLQRTVVQPGRRPPWRPPNPLVGLLERLGLLHVRPA